MVTGDHGHPGQLAQKHVEGEIRKEKDNVTILLQPMVGESVQVPAAALQEAVIHKHATPQDQVCHPIFLLSSSGLISKLKPYPKFINV